MQITLFGYEHTHMIETLVTFFVLSVRVLYPDAHEISYTNLGTYDTVEQCNEAAALVVEKYTPSLVDGKLKGVVTACTASDVIQW